MSVTQETIGSRQKGDWVVIDGVACKVTSIQTSRPGKHGHAKVRMEANGIDGKKRVIMAPGHDNIDVPIIEKKVAQVLSVNGTMANVMNTETFETFDLEIPEELRETVKEGVSVMYWEILGEKMMKQIKG